MYSDYTCKRHATAGRFHGGGVFTACLFWFMNVLWHIQPRPPFWGIRSHLKKYEVRFGFNVNQEL
jgi:hypothetical protein